MHFLCICIRILFVLEVKNFVSYEYFLLHGMILLYHGLLTSARNDMNVIKTAEHAFLTVLSRYAHS